MDQPPVVLKDKILIPYDTWWYYFTEPNMFALILKGKYETEEYGKALAHLCYGNKKLSR